MGHDSGVPKLEFTFYQLPLFLHLFIHFDKAKEF